MTAFQCIASDVMIPGITEQDQQRVVEAIKEFFITGVAVGTEAEAVYDPAPSHG